MRFEKFRSILEYNRKNQNDIASKVRDFYFQMNMNYEKDLLNLMMVVRPLFNKMNYLVIEMPFKDKEIGAISYKIDYFGYTILNSSLPKVNVNFALAHEIYHVFYQQVLSAKKIELYMNEHYYEYEEEWAANLFAGILLMPTPSFTEMFRKFKMEQSDEDTPVTIIVKLMNYFEVPYMAVVIRAYELNLLPDGDMLQELLNVSGQMIEDEFATLWLDERILQATCRDDYARLEHVVKQIGTQCEHDEILDSVTTTTILNNMRKIYDEIRG